jgi:hypothetical protein
VSWFGKSFCTISRHGAYVYLQCFDIVYDDNGKSSGLPRKECHWPHACSSFKRTCGGYNGILECKFLSENAHRTPGSLGRLALQSRKRRPVSNQIVTNGPNLSAPTPRPKRPALGAMQVTMTTGKKSGLPRGTLLATRLLASSGGAKE